MREEILLEITGTQRIDDQSDKIELTTVGEIEETDESYIVYYTEEQEPPLSPVEATVKIYKNGSAVEMTRTGAYDSCLIIEKSKRNLCHYGTQFGDILMGISGHSIESEFNGRKGCFNFGYDIDVNGALASRNEVKMIFKKNQEQ
ncbi:MAG: DUF1934 domain-containing protein [Eubacterium sp.]